MRHAPSQLACTAVHPCKRSASLSVSFLCFCHQQVAGTPHPPTHLDRRVCFLVRQSLLDVRHQQVRAVGLQRRLVRPPAQRVDVRGARRAQLALGRELSLQLFVLHSWCVGGVCVRGWGTRCVHARARNLRTGAGRDARTRHALLLQRGREGTPQGARPPPFNSWTSTTAPCTALINRVASKERLPRS